MTGLLPVGSIVKLSEKSVVCYMIIGYYPKKSDEIWDYCAVFYPGGFSADGEVHMFYADDIREVVHTGYLDEQGKELVTKFPQFMEDLYNLSKDYQEIMRQMEEGDVAGDTAVDLKML